MKLAATVLAAALACGVATVAVAQPPATAAPAAKKYSVDATPLVDLMKDAKTKPILQKHLSSFYSMIEDNIDMIPPDFTLVALADYAQGQLSGDALKAIQADFDKL
jgi:hypothetical protein